MDAAYVVFEKKARRYTVNLFGQTFVGCLQPKITVKELLDALFSTWDIETVKRLDFCLLVEGSSTPIPEDTKVSKLIAPKTAPKYVIGCILNAVVNAPGLGGGKTFNWVFALSEMMAQVTQRITSNLRGDLASFFIQVEGATVKLADFIRPLTSVTLGEFLATSPNDLKLDTSQPISPPVAVNEILGEKAQVLSETSKKLRKVASETVRMSRDLPKVKKKEMSAPSPAPEIQDIKKMEEMDEEQVSEGEKYAPPPPKSLGESRPPSPPGWARPAAASSQPPSPPAGIAMPSSEAKEASFLGADDLSLARAIPEKAGVPVVIPPTKYTVNMGMEYYSVMMEKTPYLFYVHLSQKELKIETEEGKVVYQTTFTFVAKKEEPPVLELKVYGEGFEVHPLSGKVIVMKEAVNPPLIIFSVMPVPLKPKVEDSSEGGKKRKKRKKGLDERHLHVMVTYEGDTVNHTVLGVTVQPKHYQIKLGPFHINVSKPVAMLISVATSAAASYSIITGVMKTTESPSLTDAVANVAPGMAFWVAIIMYFVALAKAIKPLKQTWQSAFAAGKLPGMMK